MISDQQRKLVYQLSYRGSKELDFICGKILKNLNLFFEDEKLLGDFLEESENDLQNWLFHTEVPPISYDQLVQKIKSLL
jgi:succinate dehydrogenase flavin-adding protein (antitoxin of CptAB toxin-antitoxin module)